jgi:zinc-ribbon domain
MFCTNCGKQIETSTAFCSFCGAKVIEPPHQQGSTVTGADAKAVGAVPSLPPGSLPLNVIEELKKYPKTTTNTCPGCGYHGLIGVGSEFISKRDLRISFLLRTAAALMALVYVAWGLISPPVFSGASFLLCAFWGFIIYGLFMYKGRHTQNFLHCPNCKRKLGPVKV